MDDWRAAILEHRQRAGLGRARLAELAGVSIETVRGYENGRRHPRLPSLEAIIVALGVTRAEANAIREGAGFAPVRTLYERSPEYACTIDELHEMVERVEWPQFVVDDHFHIVAANRYTAALWEIPPLGEIVRADSPGRNLIVMSLQHAFPDRMENWNELVREIASQIKGRPVNREAGWDPQRYLDEILPALRGARRRLTNAMVQAWLSATATAPKVRWGYTVVWNHPAAGRMRFNCIVSVANEAESLEFNDWIPVGANSWRRLEKLVKK